MTWKWEGQECVLQSRCTDELGQVQPTRAQLAKFLGHPPDYYHDHNVLPFGRWDWQERGTDNTIQPWRVAADGSVHNGLA